MAAIKPLNDHLFAYKWYLKDGYPALGINYHGCKVFGTFVCGGGSTMGYKMAGYDHLGGVEIDKKVAEVYQLNHNPKHFYLEDIRLFNKRTDLPKELFELDLLDGSPPCSSFSIAGNREKDWGKEKKFREGQENQVLDDLVFEYIKTIKKLQPKVALLENVKGLIQGNAKAYAKKLKSDFEQAGYKVQVFLLNAASMGVPQKRERVFFIGLRNDFKLNELVLRFNQKEILFKLLDDGINVFRKRLSDKYKTRWENTGNGENPKAKSGNTFGFLYKTCPKKVVSTITAGGTYCYYSNPQELTDSEYCKIGSYPLDYNFNGLEPKYLIGMSVPPVMTAQIANQIYIQWLSKIAN